MEKLKVILMIMKETFPVLLIGLCGLIVLGLGIGTGTVVAEWLGTGLIGICVLIFWILMHLTVS